MSTRSVHYQHEISHSEITAHSHPSLPQLQHRQVFFHPTFTEDIGKVLSLFPASAVPVVFGGHHSEGTDVGSYRRSLLGLRIVGVVGVASEWAVVENLLHFGHQRKKSSTSWLPNRLRSVLRVERIILSQTHPAWLAPAELNFHSAPWLWRWCLILSWFQTFSACFMSVSAPLKLVPLSLKTTEGGPRLLTNLVKAWMKESVDRSCAISMWTTRTARQVKMHP